MQSGTDAGTPAKPPAGRRERCNSLDDDQDGKTDEGCPIRLTHNPADDLTPILQNGRVAWLRRAHEVNGYQVLVRDLSNGDERVIADDADYLDVALDGDWVAFWKAPYERTRPDGISSKPEHGYALINLASGKRSDIKTEGSNHIYPPVLAAGWLLWSEMNNEVAWAENHNIHKYDIQNAAASRLVDESGAQFHPMADAEHVFWFSNAGAEYTVEKELWMLDRRTSEVKRLLAAPSGKNLVVVALEQGRLLMNERLSEASETDGGTELAEACHFVLHSPNGTHEPLGEPEPLESKPPCLGSFYGDVALYGEWLVQRTRGAPNLELWNFVTGARTRITESPRSSSQPRFDGRYLVWQDERNDDQELYYMDLSDIEDGDIYPEGRSP